MPESLEDDLKGLEDENDESPYFEVFYDRLLVERIPEDEITSTVVIPDTAKEKPRRARVLAVGQGRLLPSGQTLPNPVTIGNIIRFGMYSGYDFEVNGKEYTVVRMDEVLVREFV